ncbi:VOC family protein [Polyangium fumosum]|uniref:VOC family protein n=1 Tax=Polyangium fumosum TaxID=889272 RepID=A0A4U1IVK7_9BACT|nr:VOC family protein [Polyangium fumosum]TKC98449.1 VOC family protein [Polyangium fumosum]
MAVQLNHTIVLSRDREKSAHFLADILGLVVAKPFGPFLPVVTANGVTLDFMTGGSNIAIQHYAFLVSEEEFDAILARLVQQKVPIWADPHGRQPGRINRNDGGRGVYFFDPSGHGLEAFTRPYGSDPSTALNGITEEVPGATVSSEFPR